MTQYTNFRVSEMWLESGGFLRVDLNNVLIFCGLKRSNSEASKVSENLDFSICYSDYYGSEVQSLTANQTFLINNQEFIASLKEIQSQNPSTLSRANFRLPSAEKFKESFQHILGKIQRAEIEKAVPMVTAYAEKKPTTGDKMNWILNFMETSDLLIPFGLWMGSDGILGATPEILFDYKNGIISTVALAGTCPKSEAHLRPALNKDEKELLEHQMVIDDLRFVLSKLGAVQQEPTQVIELPTLFHLKTNLKVETRNVNVFDLTKKFHPTPALGVSPRNYGFHWMKSLPYQSDRNVFGAPICFNLGRENYKTVVAIRSIRWDTEGTKISAGCGLVKDSQFDREWTELLSKIESVYSMAGL